MEPLAILKADPLDLLFDHRNKNYGAYTLRKYYGRRLLIALVCSLSSGIFFFFLLTLGPAPGTVRMIDIGDHFLIHAETPVVMKPKPAVLPAHVAQTATANDAPPVMTPDKLIVKPIPTIAELAAAHAGSVDLPGPPETGIVPAGPVISLGAQMAEPAPKTGPEVYRTADVMPQFPGGMEALQRFLMRNLRMPETAEAGTRVSVVAGFVIGADGKLRVVDMTRSGGAAFDAEVKRVLASMPLWIPGRMGARTVPVYFSLPVQFVVPEE